MRSFLRHHVEYIIFIIYYSSDLPPSLITESVCLVGKGRLKEKCGLEPRTNFFFPPVYEIGKNYYGLDSRIHGNSQLAITAPLSPPVLIFAALISEHH